MDDEFLYKLRIDPPGRFAVRLKARLDRRANSARRAAGWSVLFVLCGTAFALSLPQVRQSMGRLLTRSPEPARPVPSPSSPAPGHAGATHRFEEASAPQAEIPSPRSRGSPASRAARSGVPQIPPAPEVSTTQQSVAIAPDIPAPVVTRIITLTAPSVDGRTPDELAREAVATRRGLFLVMGSVMTPLTQMMGEKAPVNADAAATSATRIQSLSALIADVYAIDTRPFPVDTQSTDKIWSDLPGFDLKIDQLAKAAYALSATARGGDRQAILQAASRVGAACTDCHVAYRKPAATGSQ